CLHVSRERVIRVARETAFPVAPPSLLHPAGQECMLHVASPGGVAGGAAEDVEKLAHASHALERSRIERLGPARQETSGQAIALRVRQTDGRESADFRRMAR